MSNATLLHILIAVHTLIGAVSTASLVYLFVAAWKRKSPAQDHLLLFALIWPFVNLVLMSVNGMVCPMQDWAKMLTGQQAGWVRDIYWVPENWLRIVPWTYAPSYALGAALVFLRIRRKAPEPVPPRRPA
jgi:hypothetical protein